MRPTDAGAEDCDVHGGSLPSRGRQVCLPDDWTIADRSVYHHGVTATQPRSRPHRPARPDPRRPRPGTLLRARLRAVGVDVIIAESGVAKATFYKHFPAKDDLVVAYLDRVDAPGRGSCTRPPRPPAQSLRPGSSGSSTRSRGMPPRRLPGCGFLTRPPSRCHGTPVHDRTARAQAGGARWVTGLAREAGAADPEALARTLTLLARRWPGERGARRGPRRSPSGARRRGRARRHRHRLTDPSLVHAVRRRPAVVRRLRRRPSSVDDGSTGSWRQQATGRRGPGAGGLCLGLGRARGRAAGVAQ